MHTKLGCLGSNLTYTLRLALGDSAYRELYKSVFDSFTSQLSRAPFIDHCNQGELSKRKEIATEVFLVYELVQYIHDADCLSPTLANDKTSLYHNAVVEVARLVSPSFEAENFPIENTIALKQYISDHLKTTDRGIILQNDLFQIVFQGINEFKPFREHYQEAAKFLRQFQNVTADFYYIGDGKPILIASNQNFSPRQVDETSKFLSFKWGSNDNLRNCYVLMVLLTYLHRLALTSKKEPNNV